MRTEEFTTLDGSRVLELMRPETQGARNLSLARATVAPGQRTLWHRHHESEEIYYVLAGEGILELEGQSDAVSLGDTRLIPPGVEHRITCTSADSLVILCACSPPYADEDTEVTEPVPV